MDIEDKDKTTDEAVKSSFDMIEASFLDIGIAHQTLLKAGLPEEKICDFIQKQVVRADKIAHGGMNELLGAVLTRLTMHAKTQENAKGNEEPIMPF